MANKNVRIKQNVYPVNCKAMYVLPFFFWGDAAVLQGSHLSLDPVRKTHLAHERGHLDGSKRPHQARSLEISKHGGNIMVSKCAAKTQSWVWNKKRKKIVLHVLSNCQIWFYDLYDILSDQVDFIFKKHLSLIPRLLLLSKQTAPKSTNLPTGKHPGSIFKSKCECTARFWEMYPFTLKVTQVVEYPHQQKNRNSLHDSTSISSGGTGIEKEISRLPASKTQRVKRNHQVHIPFPN